MRRHEALSWLTLYLERHGMAADRSLFWDINQLSAHTGWAHGFMAAYALWGGLACLATIWVVCGLLARRRDDGFASIATVALTGLATVLALLVNQVVGPLVDRPRPFVAMPHVLLLLSHSADPSFPSDHAVMAGAFAAGLLVASRRWGAVAAVLAVFLAFARVYCGVHYPLDVAGGLLIGAAVAALVIGVARNLVVRLLVALARTPLRPMITAAPVRPAVGVAQRYPSTPDDRRAPVGPASHAARGDQPSATVSRRAEPGGVDVTTTADLPGPGRYR
ncbi:phosphatase PAP2 family protein [Actinocatenispora thailandica]|uniref:Phosphatase PAP2 family protein n=1 Tax=Actinocatenispora thailandica TaxID=227318 RepID=A0A7R7HVA5_9ACTN|nr:phosphatase PAP2 family protein [Actinocatenispora thailandica]BCJ33967.1 phosphatase PAP2 family protein [Actinocatenispora thailandica]